MKNVWFYGKTVIITGASSGFGKFLSMKMVKLYNCNVIGIARTESKLQKIKDELGDKFNFLTFDTSIKENWQQVVNYLSANNIQPDILINNAGILPPFAKFNGEDEAGFEKVMHTNFYASVYSISALMSIIKKSKTPAIINVSSSAALASIAGTSVYSASKSALKSFTEVLALENVNMYVAVICPGASQTSIFRSQKPVANAKEGSAIAGASTDPDKLTDEMIKKIIKKKRRIVVGKDAKMMDFFARHFPVFTLKIIRKTLKKANVSILKDVYKD